MQKQGKQKGVIELRKIKAVENVEDHVLDRKTNVFQVNVQNVYSILLNMIEMQKKKKPKKTNLCGIVKVLAFEVMLGS